MSIVNMKILLQLDVKSARDGFKSREKNNFIKISKNMLTNEEFGVILFKHLREWRNRQTRTFEGRVVIPYGFKSRLSHHIEYS